MASYIWKTETPTSYPSAFFTGMLTAEKMLISRLIYTLLICSCLHLMGCVGAGNEKTAIPPPYTAEISQEREEAQLAFLSDCIRNRIDLANSYYHRARIYTQRYQFELALSDINHAISTKDNVGEYYLLRGKINRELNHLDAAMQDVERAEALQQNDPKLYVLMADILQEKNKINESSRYLNAILSLAPYDASAHYVKGMLQMKTGDTLAGLKSIEHALELNPRLFRGYSSAYQLYLSQNDPENALRILGKGLEYFPGNTEVIINLARFLKDHQRPDSSLIYYRELRLRDKENLELAADMADAYFKNRNYQEALQIYEEIETQNPNFPLINYYIGACQEKLWRWNTAKAYYVKELELSPGSPEARQGLWRISQLENERLETSENRDQNQDQLRTLDDSRIRISPILPRQIQD